MLTMRPRSDFYELLAQVKATVDCRKLIADDGTREEWDRYARQRCIHPNHPDDNPTMRIYADGWICAACGERGDAIDTYLMWHPELRGDKRAAARALLDDPELTLDGEAADVSEHRRQQRQLDPDLATQAHLALIEHPDAFKGMSAMGFEPRTIKHFKMGVARVLARLLPDEYALAAAAPGIEWRVVREKEVPYQWQWRYTFPVFHDGTLVQVVYRKANEADLGSKVTLEKDAGAHLIGRDALRTLPRVGIICSGWGDYLILWQWGFTPFTSTNGDGHWNDEWSEDLSMIPKLYSVVDADAAGRRMRKRLQERLGWIAHVELPYEADSKKDVRDYKLDGHDGRDFLKLMRLAQQKAAFRVLVGE